MSNSIFPSEDAVLLPVTYLLQLAYDARIGVQETLPTPFTMKVCFRVYRRLTVTNDETRRRERTSFPPRYARNLKAFQPPRCRSKHLRRSCIVGTTRQDFRQS